MTKGGSDPDRVLMNGNGALLYRGRMVCRLVYGSDALREHLRRAAEEYLRANPEDREP